MSSLNHYDNQFWYSSMKKAIYYDKSSFSKSLAMHLEQITSVHHQAISHTDNQNLNQKVHRVQQNMWQELIQADREG